MIVQLCGMSGAGKTTLATLVKEKLDSQGIAVEIIDGDVYRKTLCSDLGFSRQDRHQNILRLAFVAQQLSKHDIVTIISAINPFAATRDEVKKLYPNVKTVFIDCALPTLIARDTKGLYKKALLPDGHPDKLKNLTGVNDPFEPPTAPDLYINTGEQSAEQCAEQLVEYIKLNRELDKQ